MFTLRTVRYWCFIHTVLFLQVYESGEYFYSHLIGKETKDQEVKWLLQGPQGSTRGSWDLNPGLPVPKFIFLITILY